LSKVYFKRVPQKDNKAFGEIAKELLKKIAEEADYQWEKTVPIKVHFGEKGNKTFLKPECYDGMIEYLNDHGVDSAFIETNVLYRGARQTSTSHKNLAGSHGFTQLPIIIADGEYGDEYTDVEINKEIIDVCKIGKGFAAYKQYLIVSHFKGHIIAGFGGAMKQLAMGFASRGGKLAQHSKMIPEVEASECTNCGMCAKKCSFDAIEIGDVALVDKVKCSGCAGCIAVCPVGAIKFDWNGKNFKEKIAEYAYGASVGKQNIYISFLTDITKECDCMGTVMEPITEDIGIFVGWDPVAIDAACLDLLQEESGHHHFDSGRKTIDHAVKIGLGSKEYQLIEVE